MGTWNANHEEDREYAVLCPALSGLKEWCNGSVADCAWDDVVGVQLDAEGVKKAKEYDMEFIRHLRVYGQVPRSRAWRAGRKVIG